MRYFYLLRLHHWPKNSFLFIPAFFASVILEWPVIILLTQGFFCFSFVASAVYIFNDYRDIPTDKLHPTKKNRPMASGKIRAQTGLAIAIALLAAGLAWGLWLDKYFGASLIAYFVINASYSLGLKNISLLDTMIVSSGFLIRTLAGGWLVNVPISQWLVIMVFLLSFFLAMAKRRDDLVLFEESKVPIRASSRKYTIEFLNTVLSLLTGVIIVSYIMYTISDEVIARLQNEHLYVTALFVLAGLIRFLQITMVERRSGSPTKIFLTDRFIQVTVASWILCFFILIYVM